MAVILHISDIHAGSAEFDSNVFRRDEQLAEILKHNNVDYLVCSGDLTYKGAREGYSKAISFLTNITKKHSAKTILVPGNHDICNNDTKLFESFDLAGNKIGAEMESRFSSKTCFVFSSPEADFFLANTAYSGNHVYGKIDVVGLRKAIAKSEVGKKRILISHHPFLAGNNDKCSSVRNAREVLHLLAENTFTAVMHGHQHMNSRFIYKFKDSMIDVVGVRSLSMSQSDIPTGAQLVYINQSGIEVGQIDMSSDKRMTW